MILHKIDLGREIEPDGVWVRRRQADAVDVAGRPYADEFNGKFLTPADGWHQDRSVALLEASAVLAGWAQRLLDQAAKLAREAQK